MVINALLALVAFPSLASTVAIPDILEVTDIAGLAVSPDGKQVAFRTETPSVGRNAYAIEWYVAAIDGTAPPRPVADGGDALLDQAGDIVTTPPIWSPRSNAIYFRALVDGAVQVWRAAADGSGSRPVTNDPANIRDLALVPDGTAIVYHIGASRADILTAERRSHDQGVLIDASVYFSQPLINGGVVDGRLGSQRLTGDWFDRDNILWRTPLRTTILAFDRTDGRLPDSPVGVLSPTKGAIEIENGEEFAAVPLAGREVRCMATQCQSQRPTAIVPVGSDGSYLVTLDDGALNQTLAAWRPSDQSLRIITKATGLLSGDRNRADPCAIASDAAICVASAASEPPKLVRIATRDGVIDTLFDPNEALRRKTSGASRTLQWRDRTGTAFNGHLFLPPMAKPEAGYPLVISYYRCEGFLRGGVGDELPLLPLAQAGVATLCINMAHTGDVTQIPFHDYAVALSGIGSVIDTLASNGTIDRGRIGYWGLSFGSEIAFQLAMRTRLLAAVSVASGSVDPMAWWMNSLPGSEFPDVMESLWHAGDPDKDRKGWQRISPALNVATMTAPMLIQASEQEARPSMEFLTDALRAHHPVEMWAFADEAHLKSQPRHKLAAYVRNYDWFRYWLQDYQDPAPDKQDQYRRWSILRLQRDALGKASDGGHP